MICDEEDSRKCHFRKK